MFKRFLSWLPSGLLFQYKGALFVWYWPWVKSGFYSMDLDRDFNHFAEYWMAVGEANSFLKLYHGDSVGRLFGFSTETLIKYWTHRLWPHEYVVTLRDIDFSQRSSSFWSKFSSRDRHLLQEDIVILRCNSQKEAIQLLESLPREFTTASILFNGSIVGSN